MRRSFIRKILLSVLMAVFMLASIAGVCFSASLNITTKASGTEVWQTGVFEMERGVSLQFSKTGGMRFIVKMDNEIATFVKENDSAELGFVIAPQNLMEAANGDYLGMNKKLGGAIDKNKIYQDGDFAQANGCITSIHFNNLTRDFVAVAYIKVGSEVRYTEYNVLARNNLYDLVNMATLTSASYANEIFNGEYTPYVTTGDGDADGWFGTQEFPIVVENTTEYNNLVDVVNGGLNLSKYHAVIKNDAKPSYAFAETEKAPSLISSGLDTVNKLIASLPNSVAMPSGIGMVARIHEAEKAYNALSYADQIKVEGYDKLESLLESVKGYDRVYKNDATDGTVLPSHVPNNTSTIGGTATTRQDDVYGNVLTAKANADGKISIIFTNFPDVSKYEKIYFYAKIVDFGSDIYLSNGIGVDGWGTNWKNTYQADGFWCNADTFRLFEISSEDLYIENGEFAIGVKGSEPYTATGYTIEISDFYGVQYGILPTETTHLFGTVSDSGDSNEHGKIYNISREEYYITNNITNAIGTFEQNELAANLPNDSGSYYFWMYNPFTVEKALKLEGTIEGKGWIAGETKVSLAPQAWTKVVVSNNDVQDNKLGTWYVYLENSDADGWQISPFYYETETETETSNVTSLVFGNMTDSGESNEYGKIYNIYRGNDFLGQNKVADFAVLKPNTLANALPDGFEYFYFWMYNPTDKENRFHLAGAVGADWVDSQDYITMPAKQWTKVVISNADIQSNTQGQWYVYFLDGVLDTDVWQISDIYAGPVAEKEEIIYTDYADVKETIALINAIPVNSLTTADRAAVEAARAAYDALTSEQQALITNKSTLLRAEGILKNYDSAAEVVALIDSINPNNIDAALVSQARTKYEALSSAAKGYVTNLADLEVYEAEIEATNSLEAAVAKVNAMIENIPTGTTPDAAAKVFAAQSAYDALSDEGKGMVVGYATLRNAVLLAKAANYELVYTPDADGVQAIPAALHNNNPSIGATGSLVVNAEYGITFVSTATAANGKAAIQFKNFPNVSAYTTIYFYVKSSAGTILHMADDDQNGGWGTNWTSATYTITANEWTLVSLDVSTNIAQPNWVISVQQDHIFNTTLEISAIIGVKPENAQDIVATGLTFGAFTDSGATHEEFGTIYNFKQGWSSATDMGAFNVGALRNNLTAGHDSLYFWIKNPNASNVGSKFTGGTAEDWHEIPSVTLKAGEWTQVMIDAEVLTLNDTYSVFFVVDSGAKTTGWQISAIFSCNSKAISQDAVAQVQSLINDLTASDKTAVDEARTAYEALTEGEKELVDINNLIACETKIYGNVETAPFITNGETPYKIYYESKELKELAIFFQDQLASATGATLPFVTAKPTSITKYRYAIVFGHADLAEGLGFVCPSETEIGTAGYAIKRVGRTVFILAYGADGYRMGGLAFLREVVGYDMISEDCVVFSKDGAELPALDLREEPSFTYRQQQTDLTASEAFGMGLQAHTDVWIPSNSGMDMHNALDYLPVATHGSSHANWYTADKTQICPTAGGTATEFDAMVNAIVANMMVQINAYPTIENISFSIMDSAGNDACTCARCKLYNTLYGEGGFAAAWIDLMNAINAKIQPQIGDRTLNVAFLAYRSTEKAPANDDCSLKQRYVINDDGSYSLQTDGNGNPVYLKCDDNVMVWLAPIDGFFAENLNHDCNAATLATVKKWTALSNNVYLWLYGTNFKSYMLPYNTWQASAENYQILEILGVKGVWSQANDRSAMTAFTDLKSYIDSKFMFNVKADYETVLNTYFTNYFGAGASKMREMFNAIVARCEEIESQYNGLGRHIYDNIENGESWYGTKYWKKDWCENLVTLCDEAKAAVDADKSLTEAQKTAIKDRITKESLFPRYVLCKSFASNYTSSEIKKMRTAFKNDCQALGFELYCEVGGALSGLYTKWGV